MLDVAKIKPEGAEWVVSRLERAGVRFGNRDIAISRLLAAEPRMSWKEGLLQLAETGRREGAELRLARPKGRLGRWWWRVFTMPRTATEHKAALCEVGSRP